MIRLRHFFVFLGLFALTGCDFSPEVPLAETPKPAKLLKLSEASTRQSNSLPAVVRSVRTTELAFQVGGQIVEWNAVEGAEFRRGQVIARLDARSFQAAVAQAEAQFQNANSEYQRALRLIEEDAISRSVVEGRKAQMEVARASLDTARKNLSDTTLRAPFSGFVGSTRVEQFQNVGPQQSVLVLQSRAVEAAVDVAADFVLTSNQIRYFNSFIELDAAPGRMMPATFRGATGQADSATQTFEGIFRFEPPADLVVLSGMTATFHFDTELVEDDEEPAGIAVPLAAVMSDGDKRFVWLVKGRERVLERRDVELAEGVGETLFVKSGLKVGDTIVAAGGAYLEAGERVTQWKR